MSNNLHFDLLPVESTRKLAISGPVGLMRDAHDRSSEEFKRRRVMGTQSGYGRILSDDGLTLTWVLNAKVLGRAHDQAKRDTYLEGVNGFIANILSLSRAHNTQPDPKLNLKSYRPDGIDDFLFVADITKPDAEPASVKRLLSNTLVRMVANLHYPRRGRQEYAGLEEVVRSTYYGKSGVMMQLGAHSNVHSVGRDWDWESGHLSLAGSYVENGGSPLIYLAGVIAIAHADTLLQPPTTIVQQR